MVVQSVSERTRKALEEIGLTGYETKVYLSLLDSSPSMASDLSKRSGVPYSKIYDVLTSLEAKGWVEVERSRPSKFYPRSPATAIETVRMRLENKRRKNESQVLDELLAIYEQKGSKERPEIWIVRGEYNILTKMKDVVNNCNHEMLLAVPIMFDAMLDLANPLMLERRNNKVMISILARESLNDDALSQMAKWGKLRQRRQMFGGGVICDSSEVIIILSESEDDDSTLAIWSDHVGLAKFAKNYFEYLWNDSEEYQSGPKSK